MREEEWMLVYLGFSKTFNTVSHNILTEKLMKYGLHKWTVNWTENQLNCCSQDVAVSASLQLIEKWEEWLIHQMVVLQIRGTSTS